VRKLRLGTGAPCFKLFTVVKSSKIFAHLITKLLLRSPGSKSTHPYPTLTTWSYDSRLLSWLPPPWYFRIYFTDLLIHRSLLQSAILVPFYIKLFCLYYRYLESEKPSFELWILDPRLLLWYKM
jgi:hypothetical protein